LQGTLVGSQPAKRIALADDYCHQIRNLDLSTPPSAGRPLHLSAASGLVCVNSFVYVVADDELHLGVFSNANSEPGYLIRLLDGALPDSRSARKKQKPDLEALSLLPAFGAHHHGALLAFGSGIQAEAIQIDLQQGQQHDPQFRAVNPQGAVPALRLDGGQILFQSMAIMEYLNEAYPAPPLLPDSAVGRARVRALSQIAVADGHPLVTPRVRAYLKAPLGHDDQDYTAWGRHFMGEALAAIEGHLARDAETGVFSHGNQPTLADVCLVSQVVGYRLLWRCH
jgi:maleylacetoacetate isomerase